MRVVSGEIILAASQTTGRIQKTDLLRGLLSSPCSSQGPQLGDLLFKILSRFWVRTCPLTGLPGGRAPGALSI